LSLIEKKPSVGQAVLEYNFGKNTNYIISVYKRCAEEKKKEKEVHS